jgi:formylglycine-generating enzyme required for sulfatase activity
MNMDRTSGYGSVPYVYQIGEYDVTVAQYCQFLNAVAATDPYGLYSPYMLAGATWFNPTIGITRSGSPGSYSYAVGGGYNQAANCPIWTVTWGDAARFCNWLQNRQPTGSERAGTTETGAYTLDGDTSSFLETRNPGATYFIPSDNEWYKAAYYDPTNATYWTYPTQSNTAPSNVLSATGTNNANFSASLGYTGYTDMTNFLTPVGAFAASPGPYGTFDMGGDVNQWNETDVDGCRGIRGGYWEAGYYYLGSSARSATSPAAGYCAEGFRVASIPSGWYPQPGDANADGQVDINDLTIVLANFGKTGMTWTQGEFTGSGTVDINDLTLVLQHFGQTSVSSPAGLAAVPEPSALVLLGLGVGSLVACTYRRRR